MVPGSNGGSQTPCHSANTRPSANCTPPACSIAAWMAPAKATRAWRVMPRSPRRRAGCRAARARRSRSARAWAALARGHADRKHVTGRECHERADLGEQPRRGPEQARGARTLHDLAVDRDRHAQRIERTDRIESHEGADRTKGVARLEAQRRPLARRMRHAHVVHDHAAGDERERVFLAHLARARPTTRPSLAPSSSSSMPGGTTTLSLGPIQITRDLT